MKRRPLLTRSAALAAAFAAVPAAVPAAAALLAAAAPAPARAADAPAGRSYVALSMVGDKLTVVTYVPSVGVVDANRREVLPVADATFDKDALRAAAQVILKAEPGVPLSFLLANLHSHYERHERLFVSARLELPPDLLQAVRRTRASHLLLVSKRRGEARLQTQQGSMGTGRLEGLGFYLDHQTPTMNVETREVAPGFIAPYFYADVSLVDLATLDLVRTVPVTSAIALFSTRAEGGIAPWDGLSANEKVEIIRTLVTREIGAAVAAVLKPL